MCELAWFDASRKPVIVCMETNGNPHDSIHVRELAVYLVEDLDSGIAVARCFFNAPVVKPDLVFGGWDKSGKSMLVAMEQRSF